MPARVPCPFLTLPALTSHPHTYPPPYLKPNQLNRTITLDDLLNENCAAVLVGACLLSLPAGCSHTQSPPQNHKAIRPALNLFPQPS